MSKPVIPKLTRAQREILELLAAGGLLTADKHNLSSVGKRGVGLSTRCFLTSHRYVTRKDKNRPVDASGNGFVLTEHGRKVLLAQPERKTRRSPRVLQSAKNCPGCQTRKPVAAFVTVYGFSNPRGKYCQDCFEMHQQEHAVSLMEGRDFCLYCDTPIERAYDWTEDGKSARTYLHCDHMDPEALGGEDSDKNTVYCCVQCNLKKGSMPFVQWLETLDTRHATLARKIYIEKHGRTPEEFDSGGQIWVYAIKAE